MLYVQSRSKKKATPDFNKKVYAVESRVVPTGRSTLDLDFSDTKRKILVFSAELWPGRGTTKN